jgi:tRNA(Arg) A34 adenosine deaminase TadA
MESSLPPKGTLLSLKDIDNLVHSVQLRALAIGQIPISGVVSREAGKGKHELLGYGHNLLRSGLPGIHGETGAVISAGRLGEAWKGVTLTSSLNPCNFCQRLVCLHLGVRQVRILDSVNLAVEYLGYREAKVSPKREHHKAVANVFHQWVTNPANRDIWNRDIGLYEVPVARPFDVTAGRERLDAVLALATDVARRAHDASSDIPPVGAAIIDAHGEVLSVGHSRIPLDDDPSATASMVAWRNAGSREHWKDKTLVLAGTGPDHIAYAMASVFQLGQIVTTEEAARQLPLQLEALKTRVPGVKVEVLKTAKSPLSPRLRDWFAQTTEHRIREELGADF